MSVSGLVGDQPACVESSAIFAFENAADFEDSMNDVLLPRSVLLRCGAEELRFLKAK